MSGTSIIAQIFVSLIVKNRHGIGEKKGGYGAKIQPLEKGRNPLNLIGT